MTDTEHFRALETMYLAASINRIYKPTIAVAEGRADIEIEIAEKFFHAAGAVHGSVYFKMLDDAAYFAANSLEREFFLLTASFTTYLTHPITSGVVKSVGTVGTRTGRQFIAESVAYNSDGQEIGRGNGLFVRGKCPLRDVAGYGRPQRTTALGRKQTGKWNMFVRDGLGWTRYQAISTPKYISTRCLSWMYSFNTGLR
ncbi:MAG: PaaI family thioesterase [Gammaproteobacteria bacterium]|nr:PaaI family thioesterase [Gammaproteobacteria bacterium]